MTLRRISGALEPRAMRVKFATVGFQTLTFVLMGMPEYGSLSKTTLFDEVIVSIALYR